MGAFDLPDAAAAALAAGARLGWLRRLGLGWAHGLLSRVCAAILPDAASAASPPVRFWVGCAAWVRLGAWPVSRVGAYILLGVAAAALAAGALLGWLCRLGSAGRLAFVSRGCACPAGAQRMLMHRSCAGHCRPFSPLQTIAPSQRGLQA